MNPRCYLCRSTLPKFLFIAAEKANSPVTVMCRLLAVSKSGFYASRKRPHNARAARDQGLAKDIFAVRAEGRGCYATRRGVRGLRASGWRAASRKIDIALIAVYSKIADTVFSSITLFITLM